jgi:hypothetical protein
VRRPQTFFSSGPVRRHPSIPRGVARHRTRATSVLFVLGCKTRLRALLSGALLTAFAPTLTLHWGVKALLNFSAFSAAGGAPLLGASPNFPFSLDELLQQNG